VMNTIERLLDPMKIPRMVRVLQNFDRPLVQDIEREFLAKLKQKDALDQIRKGQKLGDVCKASHYPVLKLPHYPGVYSDIIRWFEVILKMNGVHPK